MLILIPAMAIDVTSLLSGFSHAGTAITVVLIGICAYLATRCEGRCHEDAIFRLHVM